jgi:hypothetical protein
MSKREIIESPWEQGVEEIRTYQLTTTPWGSSPSSPVVKLYEGASLTDVSATKLSGAASVAGDVITTPAVTGLTENLIYRLEIKFVTGGRTEEAWAEIVCKR